MSKKIRVANLNFQKAVITRLIHQSWKEVDNVDVDAMIDEAMDGIEPRCSLSSNIKEMEDYGLINTSKKEEKERKHEDEHAYEEVKGQFLNSLTPVYICDACKGIFQGKLEFGEHIFQSRVELVKHFWKEHGKVVALKPKEPYNLDYIILKALVDKYVEIHKKYVSSKYFTITCKELHNNLLWTLGFNEDDEYAPSNQTPTHILKHLGLLNKNNKREKNIMSRTSKGRIYHINIYDLEQVVDRTEFHDLKLILGTLDSKAVIQSVEEPPKPTIDEDENEDKDKEIPSVTNGGNGGLDDDWEI
jgi:hypothetical protein